jgi:hypothetical protein
VGDWLTIPADNSIFAPKLSDTERALVLYSLNELGGAFTINKLYEAHSERISKYAMTELARRWEHRGWLDTNGGGYNAPRMVTPELASLAQGTKNRDSVTVVTERDRAQKS